MAAGSDVTARFGRLVAMHRKRSGLTVRGVAERAGGISPNTICRVEAGHDLVLSSAVAIGAVLGISLDGLADPCGHCNDQPARGWTCNECGQNGDIRHG